ncbi:hypothetical protein [uncultured Aquimarina sp.]|uniref:hypothetical protein n=1 Tax=uncultured Aquimarina sp. TaxID=575652 RepID=UPI0026171EC8|nr:hypothetical protein [uncultured Aquimarina sp.]
MKNNNWMLLWCSFFLFGIVNAQDSDLDKAKVIIQKVKDAYEKQSQYNVNVDYTLYDGYEGSSVLESYAGVMVRNNENFYSKIHHTESLQTEKHYVRINHDEKAVMFGMMKAKDKKMAGLNLEILFQNFDSAIIKEKGSVYKIEMMAPPVSQSPYGKAFLIINKNDYSIKKQTLFFSSKIPVKNPNGGERLTNPRLEVVFTNFSLNNDLYTGKFDISLYVLISKTGNRISPELKNYQFIDTTRQ